MTDYVISCEAVVRLSHVVNGDHNDWFGCIRLERDVALASNGMIMAVERVDNSETGDTVCFLIPDAALIEQCRTETAFNSTLTVTWNELLGFGVAKTTFGYVTPANCCLTNGDPERRARYDNWRALVALAGKVTSPRGGLYLNTTELTKLNEASPSGGIVFSEVVDISFPSVVRDINDPNWFGLFYPFAKDKIYQPATVPEWFK